MLVATDPQLFKLYSMLPSIHSPTTRENAGLFTGFPILIPYKKPLTASPVPVNPPCPLAPYPDQAIISFFLNIPRTLHQRAEHVEHRTSVADHNY